MSNGRSRRRMPASTFCAKSRSRFTPARSTR
jgi:hypothetical protein